MMNRINCLLVGVLIVTLFSCGRSEKINSIGIIPQPMEVAEQSGHFTFNRNTAIYVQDSSPEVLSVAHYFSDLFMTPTGNSLELRQKVYYGEQNAVVLELSGASDELGTEGYTLDVSERGILIQAATSTGLFYGLQSLRQMLPPQIDGEGFQYKVNWSVPCCHIKDKPQFGWRGLLLDADPSEFNIKMLKKHIDNLALLKMNVFEWPIIGKNGLRFDLGNITTFSVKDTAEVAGVKERETQPLYPIRYTLQEIRELVRYATQRQVHLVPVINLGAIKAGGGYSRDEVLSRILNLFPTGYAHFTRGECSDLSRASQIAAVKGIKAIIPGISAGCTASHAMVLSWENIQSGQYLATIGRNIIWAPQEYCQLNSPQGTLDTDPFAGANPLSLKSCYEFTPGKYLKKESLANVQGVQADLYNNSSLSAAKAEFFLYPRLCAIAETGWSDNLKKDWDSFTTRLVLFFKHLDQKWITYSRSAYSVSYNLTAGRDRQLLVSLKTEVPGLDIHYSIDGSVPTIQSPEYKDTLRFFRTTHVRAAAFKNGKLLSEVTNRSFYFHKAAYKPVMYLQPYDSAFASSKEIALVDCLTGNSDYRSGLWQGFRGNDLSLIIDLMEPTIVSSFQMNFFHYPNRLIFIPSIITIAVSPNGIDFTQVKFIDLKKQNQSDAAFVFPLKIYIDPVQTRYIKIQAPNAFPSDFKADTGKGRPRIFLDEIIVE